MNWLAARPSGTLILSPRCYESVSYVAERPTFRRLPVAFRSEAEKEFKPRNTFYLGNDIADGTKTLKASSLNNRGYERSEHPRLVVAESITTLTGSPTLWQVHPFRVLFCLACYYPGVLATLVPPVGKSSKKLVEFCTEHAKCAKMRVKLHSFCPKNALLCRKLCKTMSKNRHLGARTLQNWLYCYQNSVKLLRDGKFLPPRFFCA